MSRIFLWLSAYCCLILACQNESSSSFEPTIEDQADTLQRAVPSSPCILKQEALWFISPQHGTRLFLTQNELSAKDEVLQGWLQTPNLRLGILGYWKNASKDSLILTTTDWERRFYEPQVISKYLGQLINDSTMYLHHEQTDSTLLLTRQSLEVSYRIDSVGTDSSQLHLWVGETGNYQTFIAENGYMSGFHGSLKDMNCDGWPDFCFITSCGRFSCGYVGFYNPSNVLFEFKGEENNYPGDVYNEGFCYSKTHSINNVPATITFSVPYGEEQRRVKSKSSWHTVAVIEEDTLFIVQPFTLTSHYPVSAREHVPPDTTYYTYGKREAFRTGPEIHDLYQYSEDVGYPLFTWNKERRLLQMKPWNAEGK